MFEIYLGPLQAGARRGLKRAQTFRLLLSGVITSLRLVERGLLLQKIGRRAMRPLDRPCAAVQKIAVALLLFRCEVESCRKVGDIRLSFLNLRLLQNQRDRDAFEAGAGLIDIGLRLQKSNPKVAIVDSRENLTSFHRLIVSDENLSDKAADLRRHYDLVGLQEGVVSRLLEAAMYPPMPTEAASPSEREQERNDKNCPPAKGSRGRLLIAGCALSRSSMERLAETAMIGKATLYARYADKSQLFADVLRRRILLIYGPLEEEFAKGLGGKSLEETLLILARGFIDLAVAPSSIALGRILAAQGERFPELGKLAIEEGLHRQIRLMETILARFSAAHRYAIDDMALAADLFLSIVLGRISLMALLGVQMDPETLDRRVREAVRIFVRGLLVDAI